MLACGQLFSLKYDSLGLSNQVLMQLNWLVVRLRCELSRFYSGSCELNSSFGDKSSDVVYRYGYISCVYIISKALQKSIMPNMITRGLEVIAEWPPTITP